MPKAPEMPAPALVTLCERFRERADHLGYKGKKRDDAAIDFVTGACVGLRMANDEGTATLVEVWLSLRLAVRGYVAIGEVLKRAGKL